jgi:hypothetical protein
MNAFTNDIGDVQLQAVWTDPEFDPGTCLDLTHLVFRSGTEGQVSASE